MICLCEQRIMCAVCSQCLALCLRCSLITLTCVFLPTWKHCLPPLLSCLTRLIVKQHAGFLGVGDGGLGGRCLQRHNASNCAISNVLSTSAPPVRQTLVCGRRTDHKNLSHKAWATKPNSLRGSYYKPNSHETEKLSLYWRPDKLNLPLCLSHKQRCLVMVVNTAWHF